MIKSYKDLEVWKNGIELVNLFYEITKKFPADERFALVSQIQRAAVSVPSNIAEGHTRQYTKEFRQFLYISLGSCAELETLMTIAKARNFVEAEVFKKIETLLDQEGKMLRSLIAKLEN